MTVEEMTREEAIREIREKTPQLLADYRALAAQLAVFFGETEEAAQDDRPEMDMDELTELYEGLLEFAESYDLDSADMLLQQAKEYRIPEAEKERFAKIEQCVRDSDWDTLKQELTAL